MITTALQSCCDVILIVAKTLLQCVEVKPGDCVKIDELEVANVYIHISQVALGEASKNEKSKEPVVVYLKVGVQKLVLGTLNREEIPQIPLDLVLDQEAKLSHTCQSASVYFCGYRANRYPLHH
ncbi:histone deacetylase HDT1-like [Arachis ipaensis]|uniref:histone deacetylase HDT1-like n=1 Tax=Arachis ipaensis TaxID=130454 RepID=UPI000A2B9590|nr:histone deacetylase HDT1-like [Arachis ipaensis]